MFPISAKKCEILSDIFAQIFHKCEMVFNSSVFHFVDWCLIPVLLFWRDMVSGAMTIFLLVTHKTLRAADSRQNVSFVGSVAERVMVSFLQRRRSHDLGSTCTLVTLLHPWIKHFTMIIISAWWLRTSSKFT